MIVLVDRNITILTLTIVLILNWSHVLYIVLLKVTFDSDLNANYLSLTITWILVYFPVYIALSLKYMWPLCPEQSTSIAYCRTNKCIQFMLYFCGIFSKLWRIIPIGTLSNKRISEFLSMMVIILYKYHRPQQRWIYGY